MTSRRPNLIRWTNYMKECIEVLESHPDAYPSDKLFCQYVKIQHICEDIGFQFLMDDNTANISINDPKVTYTLNILNNQLQAWKEQVPVECRVPELIFFEHVTALYLHEIALHINHNIEDFRLPFTEESLKTVPSTSDTLTQGQMAALEACLEAAHGILDTMLSMEVLVLKTLPLVIYFVRCIYAIVILIKMHVAICTPHSELGKMMRPEDMKIEFYIDAIISLFDRVAPNVDFRPRPKILRIFNLLREWFIQHKDNFATQPRRDERRALPPERDTGEAQTPLQLLSRVATGDTLVPRDESRSDMPRRDWAATSPDGVAHADRNRTLTQSHPSFTVSQQSSYPDSYSMLPTEARATVDPSNPELGWGTGFEQAYELALGGMDGVHSGGLDGWFLGDSVAPFAFNDVNPPHQWQPSV